LGCPPTLRPKRAAQPRRRASLRRTPQGQQQIERKRDISNEVRKGTFLKRLDKGQLRALPRPHCCASIRLVRRSDQGYFAGPSPPPHGDPGAGHVLLPQFQLTRRRPAPEFCWTDLATPTALRSPEPGGFMKSYLTKDIRNVGIVGHGGTGKTQLVSVVAFTPRG